jgi:hypothetical protein
LENTHSPGEWNISRCHLGANYEKGKRKTGTNVKKIEERGKKNRKKGSKSIKKQNKEKLSQKCHDRVEK